MTGRWALARLAARSLQRHLRASWLVVLLIALPVAVGSYLAIASRTVSDHGLSRAQLAGVGDTALIVQGGETKSLFNAPLDQRRQPDSVPIKNLQRFMDRVESEDENALALWTAYDLNSFIDSKSVRLRKVVAADWSRPAAGGVFRSIEGRLPTAAGEVALDTQASQTLNLGLGDRFETTAGSLAEVVGVVTPFDATIWSTPAVYVDHSVVSSALLQQHPRVGVSIGVSAFERAQLSALQAGYGLRQNGAVNVLTIQNGDGEPWRPGPTGIVDLTHRPEQIGAVITSGLLIETALLAAAAFVVRGRRRLTEVSRLTAIGATPPQISRMMLAEAGLLGLCGAALGATVAVVAAVADLDLLTTTGAGFAAADESGAAFSVAIHPSDLLLSGVLAVGASVLAAWLPARRASRLSARQAESGALTQDQAGTRWNMIGLALAVISLAAIDLSDRAQHTAWAMSPMLSTATMVVAVLLMIGAAVAVSASLINALAQHANRLPLSLRFGLRRMARNRARSAALSGGIAVVTMAAMMFLALLSVLDSTTFGVPEGTGTARILTGDPSESSVDIGHFNRNSTNQQDGAPTLVEPPVLAEIGVNIDVDHQVPLHYVVDSNGDRAGFKVRLQPDARHHSWRVAHPGAVVATPELVAALDLSNEMVSALNRPGTALVPTTFSENKASLWDTNGGGTKQMLLDVVRLDRPDLWQAGVEALIAPGQAPDGYQAAVTDSPSEWLVASTDGFSEAERTWLKDQSDVIAIAAVYDSRQQLLRPQLVALGVVTVLVLIIARLASGLVAVESDRDAAIMTAVGAPAGIRRRLLGSQVGLITALSVVSAVPLGLVFVWVFLTTLNSSTIPPWAGDRLLLPAPLYFIGLALLLPLAAAGFVMVTTRSGETALSRRLT